MYTIVVVVVLLQVQEKVTKAVAAVIADLRARFPPSKLASAMGCVHPSWWQQHWGKEAMQQEEEFIIVTRELTVAFCESRSIVGGASVA